MGTKKRGAKKEKQIKTVEQQAIKNYEDKNP
jgi:hypothetical protein